ncbi:hypothetical protein GOODEAATRI_032574 [Goodea atripinnis]|uniref:Uncharacterized protein n=1 Tax=Goodea atripinnis TaxID=208336 RepID=A0ABV0MMJ2_9TELE
MFMGDYMLVQLSSVQNSTLITRSASSYDRVPSLPCKSGPAPAPPTTLHHTPRQQVGVAMAARRNQTSRHDHMFGSNFHIHHLICTKFNVIDPCPVPNRDLMKYLVGVA